MRLKRTSATALGERKFRIGFGWDLDESKQSNQIGNLSNQIRFDPRCHVLTVCPHLHSIFSELNKLLPQIHSAISYVYAFMHWGNPEAGL